MTLVGNTIHLKIVAYPAGLEIVLDSYSELQMFFPLYIRTSDFRIRIFLDPDLRVGEGV